MISIDHIGDFIIFDSIILMNGRARFNTFVETIQGITATRYLTKKFRITTDEIFWSDWQELTEENLSSEQYRIDGKAIIRIQYTREGIDDTGSIVFSDIIFDGEFESVDDYIPTIKKSMFYDLYSEDDTRILTNNLFKKLYYYGIVPNYIERGDNLSKKEDIGFINFFYSVSKFFSLIFRFSEKFEDFTTNYNFLLQNVIQNDLIVNKDITIEDLLFLSSHLLDETRKRGSSLIFLPKGTQLIDGSQTLIDGEFLRLMNHSVEDELITINLKPENCNFFVGKNSPLYKGFPYFEKTPGEDGLYNVDSKISYVITFDYYPNPFDENIKIELKGYTKDKTIINTAFKKSTLNNISSIFLEEDLSGKLLNDGTAYKIECFVFSFNTSVVEKDKLNLGWGNNLIFNSSIVKYIEPIITTLGSVENLTVKPAVVGLNIRNYNDSEIPVINQSICYIGKQDNFLIISKNKNRNLSQEQLEQKIEKFLIPYNKKEIIFLIR